MSGENEQGCNGVCVFHDKYESQLTEVFDWHQGAKVEMINLLDAMQSLKRWVMGLVGTVVGSFILQLFINWPKK